MADGVAAESEVKATANAGQYMNVACLSIFSLLDDMEAVPAVNFEVSISSWD